MRIICTFYVEIAVEKGFNCNKENLFYNGQNIIKIFCSNGLGPFLIIDLDNRGSSVLY